ncbi:hypothetical protein SAMN05444320_107110 [Streptoalloteichus hindustanus]|uniref:ARB-07466-like C-terminal domain-containing protein n=2 Tax=Streptoalloteichus hindustanus TaxID=2017 RepID=A0A1M5I553_STRHI|nr:hypothetical protein SAMN05444320_107110 [Streptoalloteichus hindustanus]
MPPPTPEFGPEIDGYAPNQPYRACDPKARPGVAEFRDLVLATYRDTKNLGIVRACDVGGDSEHKEGRAWDWGVNVNGQEHIANDLLNWLLSTDRHGNEHALARRWGIMYIIWNRRIWEAYAARAGWTRYPGPSPHTDHVHFSFSWAGARKETTWWKQKPRDDMADVPQWQWDRVFNRVLRMSAGVEGENHNGEQFNHEQNQINDIIARLDRIQSRLE